MQREHDSRGDISLPKRTTTVVSSSTSTRTITDAEAKIPNPSPSTPFTPGDRFWFNWKDITTTPFRGRAPQRVLWAVSACWTLALLLMFVGLILSLLSSKLGFAFFVFSLLTAVVLPIFFPWPVYTEANQYWVHLGRGGYPIRFLKQDMERGYKTHYIRPYQSVKFYRANKPLKCEITWTSTAFVADIELKVTGTLEFYFDPTQAPRKEYLHLLNDTDTELEKRLAAGVFSVLNQTMQDTIRMVGLNHIWDQGVPALIQRLAAFFEQLKQRGYYVLPASSVIYITLPRQVAQENMKAWAEEAKAQASTINMKVFFDFAGQQPNADSVFKMMNTSTQLRVTLPGSKLTGPVLPTRQGGIWVDPLTLSYGNIIQGFSRRVLPSEDIVPAQLPAPAPLQADDDFPKRPPRYQ